MYEYVREALLYLQTKGNPDITLIITSNGGDVEAGLNIYDLIDTYKGKVFGKVQSFARSISVVILQACTTREATYHSQILIHHVSRRQVSFDTLSDEIKLKELIDRMNLVQERLYLILEKRTGKKREEIVKACKSDTDMTAQQALEFGLIGKITESREKED